MIHCFCSIPVKNCPLSLFYFESLGESFAQAVGVVGVDLGSDLHVVGTEEEVLVVGGEECGVVQLAEDLEVEGTGGVLEADARQVDGEAEVTQGVGGEYALLWHLEPGAVGVSDLEAEVVERIHVQWESQPLDDGAAIFDVVLLRPRVLQAQRHRWRVTLALSHLVFWSTSYKSQQHYHQHKIV